MARLKRPELAAEARRLSREQLARLGGEARASRRRRRMTQTGLGRIVGVVQSTISQAERGEGGSLSLDVWQRIFLALGRRLVVEAGRDSLEQPRDAGHLRIQELLLRLGRSAGYQASFELPTRPADPARSVDVMLRDDVRRLLVVVEAWNTIGDIGAAVRSFQRKLTEAEALAIAIGGQRPHRVCGLWVVRAVERNRRLLASYPELFAGRFPASSAVWASVLAGGSDPPTEPGLVWCDVSATRIFPWRRRSSAG